MARINSDAGKDTFTANLTANRTATHARNPDVRALEEGSLPLHPVGITKTTAFRVESDGRQIV